MDGKAKHIELVIGKRADGHVYIFRYTVDRVDELYRVFDRLADRDDCSFDWDDVYILTTAVRARLHQISSEVRP